MYVATCKSGYKMYSQIFFSVTDLLEQTFTVNHEQYRLYNAFWVMPE